MVVNPRLLAWECPLGKRGSFARRPYKMRPKRLEKVDPVGQPGDSRPLVSEGHLRAIAAYGPFHE